MLKASTLASKRNLELRVVPLPAGADPADLIQAEGPEAITQAVERSVPFVRFRVERALATGDVSSPEGRDRILSELRPVFATLPPSAMRMELTGLVSSRLSLPASLAEQVLAEGRAPAPASRAVGQPPRGEPVQANGAGGGNGARREPSGPRGAISRRGDTERAFLALCIASPQEGAKALAGIDVEEDFSSAVLRRAATHLRAGDLSAPLAPATGENDGGPAEDPELMSLLAELIVQAGSDEPNPGMLEVQRLQLELARLERGIQRARGQEDSDVEALAREKAQLKVEFDLAYSRVLEETGEREF
jgi:DNA primase